MKFQNSQSFSIAPGVQRITGSASSGSALTIIPGRDPIFSVTIQQLIISWTDVTTPGQINISSQPADPNPFIVYQNSGGDTIVVPFYSMLYDLGTYGLRAANNAVGGVYTVTAFYTQILP